MLEEDETQANSSSCPQMEDHRWTSPEALGERVLSNREQCRSSDIYGFGLVSFFVSALLQTGNVVQQTIADSDRKRTLRPRRPKPKHEGRRS